MWEVMRSNLGLTNAQHRRGQDFSKGGSHCVKVRVLVCLDIFNLKRHGISATCCRLLIILVKKGLQKGGHRHPRTPLAMPLLRVFK